MTTIRMQAWDSIKDHLKQKDIVIIHSLSIVLKRCNY